MKLVLSKIVIFSLLIFAPGRLALPGEEIEPAFSKETRLRVANKASSDIVSTVVIHVDPSDFEGNARPDYNFQDVKIPVGKYEERREEVKKFAKHCPFTMTLNFEDGTQDQYTINQKYALGDSPNFKHTIDNHNIKYERVSGNILEITVSDK